MLPGSETFRRNDNESDSDSDDLCLLAAVQVATCPDQGSLAVGSKPKGTARLPGDVGKHKLLILIDSGSAASFISQSLADKLHCGIQPMQAVKFTVADGAQLQCETCVPDFEWAVQGHTFQHTINVLPLGGYDMILGKDWLDTFSPMWVHWKRQILRFTHKGQRITLHGVQTTKPKCKQVSAKKLRGIMNRGGLTHIVQVTGGKLDAICALNESVPEEQAELPPMIDALLQEFHQLFDKPTQLPPRREQDHHIPLIPGA